MPYGEKHPYVIPDFHPMAVIIVDHCHPEFRHTGRHITARAVRQSGYRIVRYKKVIKDYLKKCVNCKKLQADVGRQKMADLPSDRVQPAAPFRHVGINVFGINIHNGKQTRSTPGTENIWALIVVCFLKSCTSGTFGGPEHRPIFVCSLKVHCNPRMMSIH